MAKRFELIFILSFTALTVRYLTRRYIGEYKSHIGKRLAHFAYLGGGGGGGEGGASGVPVLVFILVVLFASIRTDFLD